MRIFNRIVMVLVLAGLFVLGLYAVAYAFDLFGTSLQSLLSPVQGAASGTQGFLSGAEQGELSPLAVAVLVLVALLGLILLILELKPPTPRLVRMDKGTFVTRGVVEQEITHASENVRDVLGSSVRARAKRRPGAQVDLEARVRRGEDTNTIQGNLRGAVQEYLGKRGLPVSKLNVKMLESDPRQAKTRVQ